MKVYNHWGACIKVIDRRIWVSRGKMGNEWISVSPLFATEAEAETELLRRARALGWTIEQEAAA